MTKFEVDNEREMVDAKRAAELLKQLDNGVRHISLSGKSYGVDAAEAMRDSLKDKNVQETLATLNLADAIAGRPEAEALRALETLCEAFSDAVTLTSIDLSDNALGSKGVSASKKLLSGKPELEHLFFRNNGLNADAVRLIGEIVRGGREELSLKTLHLSKNLLESPGAVEAARIIEKSPNMEEFVMTSTRVGREGSVAISKALAGTPLRHLEVSDNTFGEEGAEALAEVLRGAADLEVAILRDLSVEDDGMRVILEALMESSPNLRVLDISTNELTEDIAELVGECLRSKTKLEKFLAEENELGSDGAEKIAAALDKDIHTQLQEISLADNSIGKKGALAVGRAAENLPALKKVDLNSNTIAEDAIDELTDMFAQVLGDMDGNMPEDDEDE
mmetsp:Transcript_5551/g.16556  ORF Transcript_5551/g.16556 Transcript_5551/m.16556 type:complete len:392 (-) Transcript_5551:189-1364(-)|eukprot:CAMPEP_0198730696 /NCGR_PEP_ID=MMETSP1475-20131203/25661_1 /TAXON_ID= ORGANISM="Unidentified sp., Strain CCMP1999" /NCGR_SAMPLE_ID=MMETSP1475 /ASSEMBLY_ACC=CAM_ASM_001111 /LENGTH=391 /DNA_ID=CAMNT_0044493535 /DNA_START=36 /DNA_END=1211 /DNA_ORIENTATION=-